MSAVKRFLWFCWLAGFAGAAADSPVPWHHPLYLANHGYWPWRVPVRMINDGTNSVAGELVRVGVPGLAGVSAESVRVCNRDGLELLYDVLSADGSAKRHGTLAADDQIVLPAECGPQSSSIVCVYAGNESALGVPDFLRGALTNAGRTTVRAIPGAVERLNLATPPPSAAASFSAEWPVRAVVRAFNVSTQSLDAVLVMVDLRPTLGRWLKIPPGAAARVVDAATGKELTSGVRSQNNLLFSAALPARSIREFLVFLDPRKRQSAEASLAGYEQLLKNSLNLAPNPSFEDASLAGWTFSEAKSPDTYAASAAENGRFGRRSATFFVDTNLPGGWRGWRSREIPVRPGASYFYSGFLKSKDLDGPAALNAHWHASDGKMTASSAFVGTAPAINGGTDWTQSSAFVRAPADAASIQLHLTMNTHGTLQHDGLIFCEVHPAEVVRLETAESTRATDGLRVAAVNPLIKVFPDDPPAPSAAEVGLECARNEFEPFQLVVRSDRAVKNLRALISPLRNGTGETLPAVKVERVGFVPVDHPSAYFSTAVEEWQRKLPHGSGSTDGWAGRWPDPLVPTNGCDLAAHENQPFWFTARSRPETKPGDYRGEVIFRADGIAPVTVPVTVKVLPFALPARTKLRAIFDFRQGPGGSFGGGKLEGAERRKWLRFFAEHRLGVDAIEPSPTFTYTNGRVTMDATAFDEAARFCFDELGMNVSYTPHSFYMFGWAYPPRARFGFAAFTPEWTAAFQQAYRLFTGHVKLKGWHDKFVYYISDEPHFDHDFVVEQMKKLCALIHGVDTTIPIYSSTWRHCAAWDNSLDLWGVGQHGGFPVAELEQIRQAGKHFWFTCDGQMATDTPYLATERMLPYYCFKYGAEGFEFWGNAWWTYDPWQIGWHTFIRQSDDGKRYYWTRYPNGDGFLAYPGKPAGVDGPVSTIRLEQLREGLEDFEAISMLAQLVEATRQAGRSAVSGERALAMAKELVMIPNAGGLRSTEILSDPDQIPAIRIAVNAAIVELGRFE